LSRIRFGAEFATPAVCQCGGSPPRNAHGDCTERLQSIPICLKILLQIQGLHLLVRNRWNSSIMRHNTKLSLVLPLALLLGGSSPHAQLTQFNFEEAISGMMSANSRAAQVGRLRSLTGIVVIRLKDIVVLRPPGDEPNVAAIGVSAQKNAAG